MTESTHRDPPLARLVGRRPNRGAVDAAKVVVSDLQQLLRAEIDLAKAEVADGVKAKVMGAGFFIAAAVVGWLALNTFLVFLGFVLALFMPAWVAVGVVLLLLVLVIALLGFLGLRKFKAELSLQQSAASREASKQATMDAVDQAKANAQAGVEEAKVTLAETAEEVRGRLQQQGLLPAGKVRTALSDRTAAGDLAAVSESGPPPQVPPAVDTPAQETPA